MKRKSMVIAILQQLIIIIAVKTLLIALRK